MKRPLFKGVATALITPFTDNGQRLDMSSFERLISHQLENNTDALVICGTTGESPVLSRDEKSLLFRKAVEACNNKVPVIAGTGSNNTVEAVKKSNEAEKMGVNGLLVVTPYYNKCTQEGLVKHYEYIAERVSTPIIVYNVPSRTGVSISAETYEALAEINKIEAVKEASSSYDEFLKTSASCRSRLDFYTGNDDMTVPFIKNGGLGVISVASNIIPDIMRKITQLCFSGCYDEAEMIYHKYRKLISALFTEPNPIPVKFACSRLLNTENLLRLPLTPLSNDNRRLMIKLLRECELS